MRSGPCKSLMHEQHTCKINLIYIQQNKKSHATQVEGGFGRQWNFF